MTPDFSLKHVGSFLYPHIVEVALDQYALEIQIIMFQKNFGNCPSNNNNQISSKSFSAETHPYALYVLLETKARVTSQKQ